ncbi:MAG: hypothetical protein LBT16_13880 [Treponema sp.]|nr:hypothetical protein [Treponema sp.]
MNWFFKKRTIKTAVIDLSKWEALLKMSDTWLGTAVTLSHIDDVGIALAHTDEKIRRRFITHFQGCQIANELSAAIDRQKNVSKLKSDEAKNLLASMLETRKNQIATSI